MLTEVSKNPRNLSWDLHATPSTVGVKVYASIIGKCLQQFSLQGWCVRKSPLLSKQNIKASLQSAIEHIKA